MKTKLNIAEILKDKPIGTKLYSIVHGECTFEAITDEIFKINFCNSKFGLMQAGECILIKFGNMYDGGECIIFPSKEMRDWSKFAWKKGDVLVSKGRRTLHVIFEEFNDDTYTTFKGKHFICDYSNKENCDNEEYYNDYHKEVEEQTIEFEKDNVNNAQTYINIIERKLGNKLNRKILEIEKQLKFKNGDILFVRCDKYSYIEIFNYFTKNGDLYDHSSLNITRQRLDTSGILKIIKEDIIEIRLATEEEKKQLLSALAKENKAWDAEKKQIVDLKPKVDELKPFDKVLVRDDKEDQWSANIFSYQVRGMFHCLGEGYWKYCIPYEGNEHLLGTTKNVED